MPIVRNILLFPFLLVFGQSAYATKIDTTCRKIFIEKVMDGGYITNVFFSYLDSSGAITRKLMYSPIFFNKLMREKKIDRNRIRELLIKDSVFTFSEFGYIGGNELRDTRLYNKLMRKGKKRYLRHYFENKVMIPKYTISSDPDFVAIYGAGYSFGIFIAAAEEKEVALYISDCK